MAGPSLDLWLWAQRDHAKRSGYTVTFHQLGSVLIAVFRNGEYYIDNKIFKLERAEPRLADLEDTNGA